MVVTYKYDVLNRLVNKLAPTDFDNMNGAFVYDQGPNGIGRMSSENRNTVGGEAYSYDEAGRITATTFIQYHANSAATGMGIVYDLAGHPTQLTYPDGRVIGQKWDTAGRLQSITDTTSGGSAQSYFNLPSSPLTTFGAPSTQYWPSGALANVQLSLAITAQFSINSRLQPAGYASASSFLGKTSYRLMGCLTR